MRGPIENIGFAKLSQHDVLWLDVPRYDTTAVSIRDGTAETGEGIDWIYGNWMVRSIRFVRTASGDAWLECAKSWARSGDCSQERGGIDGPTTMAAVC